MLNCIKAARKICQVQLNAVIGTLRKPGEANGKKNEELAKIILTIILFFFTYLLIINTRENSLDFFLTPPYIPIFHLNTIGVVSGEKTVGTPHIFNVL